MTNHRTHIAAPPGQIYWRKEVCPSPGAKVLLRTVGGVAVVGQWNGPLDRYYTAWCPLPTSGMPPAPVQQKRLTERLRFAFKLIFNPRSIK